MRLNVVPMSGRPGRRQAGNPPVPIWDPPARQGGNAVWQNPDDMASLASLLGDISPAPSLSTLSLTTFITFTGALTTLVLQILASLQVSNLP